MYVLIAVLSDLVTEETTVKVDCVSFKEIYYDYYYYYAGTQSGREVYASVCESEAELQTKKDTESRRERQRNCDWQKEAGRDKNSN